MMTAVPQGSRRQRPPCGSPSAMMSLWLTVVVVVAEWGLGVAVPVPPSARIVVRVRKRRAEHWDPWQINSNVCPPSLCKASSEGSPVPAPRPRGTGGSVFYQGDIVLDKAVDRYIFPEVNHTRFRRATVRLRDRMWKDGVVPYVISKGISAQARRVILRAFKHISQKTCITFRKKKDSDKDFVKFISEPGCWSAIGQTGGRQLLSLGRGCENVGTAVHEITHSLGVWHEQARKDRDKYVRILVDNVSDRFLKDFEKVDKRVSNSRGFPYDYLSVMHYSRFAFTRNGKPTIEVIGEGKKLGFTLKQRSGLSTIDVAQLRDMYRCNLLADTKKSDCPKGWHQHDRSCYKFYDKPRAQFAAAAKKCGEERGRLVWVESRREEQFLARYLLKHFPKVLTWRTGARRIGDTMVWYKGKGAKTVKMTYSNWATDHPSTFSSGVLRRDRSTNETRWQGVWAGSMAQMPDFTYPFICERRAKRPCLKLRHKDGRDYRGRLSHTLDGFTCQKWTEQYPHQHNLSAPQAGGQENADGLGDHNYCRNPKKQRRSRPWCYTAKETRGWQLCDVTTCSAPSSGSRGESPSSSSSGRNSARRVVRHSGGKAGVERPAEDQGEGRRSGSQPSPSPSRPSGRRKGAGKGRRKGKGRRRPGRKERRGREGQKRRRGRRQRQQNRGQSPKKSQ